ncbi:histidine kinase [Leptospira fainei serovar Hurstbridge str. BUT 6]|uniref:Histidine kinase n=1 Tax=Leptospira fainei serovar Hurstbridge str. BUT 6 TaxID=1193011 RepID=S3VGE8_9LEPT|nr:PAS domain S-box protein [Leptospira fainei]EPG75515.1 histidine kinase [Leptospira fainei serovar Hurstbridge str. BUT 6]
MSEANFYNRIFENGSGILSVLENIPVLIMAIDEHSRIAFWNRELEKVTGYSFQEATEDAEHFFALLLPDKEYRKSVTEILLKSENHFENWEIKLRTKGNETKTVSWSRVPAQSSHLKQNNWIIGIDVTQRVDVEQNLQKSVKILSDFQTALNAVSIVAITDKRGTIIYSNDNFCKISGYSKDELLGQNHRIINSGYHDTEFFRNLWQTISRGKIWRGEIRNKAKDGRFYWVDTTISPIFDEKGKPFQYLVIRNEITERKEAEEKARLAEHSLKTFQDRMSPHFLFNTLSIIHSYLETNSALADSAILMLAENYRFLIDNASKQLVPFDIEWQFMENYINLLKLRFQDFMDVEISKEGDFRKSVLPPLILQPLVENSYIHGIRDRDGRGKIWVNALIVGDRTTITIRDNGEGVKSTVNHSRTLGNISERLKYYLSGSELKIENHPEGGAVVTVTFDKPKS